MKRMEKINPRMANEPMAGHSNSPVRIIQPLWNRSMKFNLLIYYILIVNCNTPAYIKNTKRMVCRGLIQWTGWQNTPWGHRGDDSFQNQMVEESRDKAKLLAGQPFGLHIVTMPGPTPGVEMMGDFS
jgi:hypothetical protein